MPKNHRVSRNFLDRDFRNESPMLNVSRFVRCVEFARLRQALLLTNYNTMHVKAELKISLRNLARILLIYTRNNDIGIN